VSEQQPVRVFAPGAFTYSNKGDATLVFAFLTWLRSAFTDVEVTLTSFAPEADQAHYEVPVIDMVVRPRTRAKAIGHRLAASVPLLRDLAPVWAYGYVTLICWLIPLWVRLYGRMPAVAGALAPRHVLLAAKAIEEADLVATVPGGFLLAPSRLDHWWLFHVPTLVLAAAMGKSVLLGPCSIGPFDPFYTAMARRTLTRCVRIYVREDWSKAYLRELGVDSDRVVYCPDLAFLFDRRTLEATAGRTSSSAWELMETFASDGGRPVLGVSVREHSFPGTDDPAERQRLYFEAVAGVADQMVEQYRAHIVVLPQTLEDLPAGRMIESKMVHQADLTVLEDDFSPSDLQELYSRCTIVLGTRMHANILAMCADTPVVAIGYQPKTEGIMVALGLQEWVVPIDDVRDLLPTVSRAWLAAGELREALPAKIETLRAEARARAKEMATLIDRNDTQARP
jgi:colanic acid/amylovoran biosynthesis protein